VEIHILKKGTGEPQFSQRKREKQFLNRDDKFWGIEVDEAEDRLKVRGRKSRERYPADSRFVQSSDQNSEPGKAPSVARAMSGSESGLLSSGGFIRPHSCPDDGNG
jgi:hypothetical protein